MRTVASSLPNIRGYPAKQMPVLGQLIRMGEMEYQDIIYMTYQRNDDTESADRPATEIEITDEMVRAGVRALACYGSDDDLETAVWSVLQAAIPLAGLGR